MGRSVPRATSVIGAGSIKLLFRPLRIVLVADRDSWITQSYSTLVCPLFLTFWFAEDYLTCSDLLTSHLTAKKVEDLISENSRGFLDQRLHVEVSTGQSFVPMRLEVNMFEPRGSYLLFQRDLEPKDESSSQSNWRECAPVGLLAFSNDELEETCQNYIHSMLQCPCYAEAVTKGESSPLRRKILAAVFKYSQKVSNKPHDERFLY